MPDQPAKQVRPVGLGPGSRAARLPGATGIAMSRHCEARSAEAIQAVSLVTAWIASAVAFCALGTSRFARNDFARNDGDWACNLILAPAFASESCPPFRPRTRRGRREGREPAAPMVRVQQEARGRTTGSAATPAFPARWFERLLRTLPGAPGFLATVAHDASHQRGYQRRGIRTVRLDRAQQSCSSARMLTLQPSHAHRIPRPTSVTIATRPSDRGGTATRKHNF
jgi:hypothetical protein